MPKREWKAPDLMRLANGYWSNLALQAGVRTGLLPRLAKGLATADELARELGLDPRATGELCQALAVIGVLEERDRAWALHPDLVQFMDPDSPQSKVNYVEHMADLVPAWAQLAECVRTGKPVERRQSQDGKESPGRTHFYLAMRDIARAQAQGLAARLGLRQGQRLLDLGGGPGVYGLTFSDETPGLIAAIFDLPGAKPAFDQEAALHQRGGEVAFIQGDYAQDPLGGPYDVIWISQVLHGEGPSACQELISKAAAALAPGGVLWVQEFFVGPQAPRHPWPALFSLNMLVNTPRGKSYSVAEVCGFMRAAGLTDGAYQGPTVENGPSGLVKGMKP